MTSTVSTVTDPKADAGAGSRPRAALLQRNLAVVATTAMIVFYLVNGLTDVNQSDKAATLRYVGAHHTRVLVAIMTFMGGQVCAVGAALGLAWLLRHRSPRLGVVGALLTILGSFGHAVYGGLTLSMIHMAEDPVHLGVYAALLTSRDALPYVGVFAVLGLAGVIGGTIVMSIGVFRGRLGPRWVAPVLWAFLLLDFVGSGVVGWLAYIAVGLAALAWIMIIREMLHRW